MPFKIDAPELSMQDKVVCDSRVQLHISKPFETGSLIVPEFGQTVVCRVAATTGDSSISVAPLVENLSVGRRIRFDSGVDAIVSAPALKGDKTVSTQTLTGDIAAFEEGTTNGVDQVITLANPLSVGDQKIEVAGLSKWLTGYRTLDFGNNVMLRTTGEVTDEGATEIFLDRPAEYALAAGATASISSYVRLLSANSADDSSNANILNERNFESGTGTAKSSTSRSDSISFSGCFVKYDDAIDLLYEMGENPDYIGCSVRCILGVNQKGARTVAGNIVLGTNSSQRPNDQAQKVQFTLDVDGRLTRHDYTVIANSFK